MRISIERSFDYETIRAVMTHPRIYPWMIGDGAPEKFQVPQGEYPWYLLANDGDELLGMFILVPWNPICWEVHVCLLPNAWGERALKVCQQGIPWLWRNSPCRKLIGCICRDNRLALRFALRAGAAIIGVNTASLLKGGELKDQIIVGIGRDEATAEAAHAA